jgi:hypothetical protein
MFEVKPLQKNDATDSERKPTSKKSSTKIFLSNVPVLNIHT